MKSLGLARQLRRQKIAEASGSIATAYFGPEIDAGYSYGKYTCASCGFEQLSNKGEMIHCVNCGAPSKLKTTASFKAVKKVTKKVASEFYCPTCGSFTVSSSAEASKDPRGIYCPQCGSSMEILGEDTNDMSEESTEITGQGKDIDVIEDDTTEESTAAMNKDIEVIEDTTAEMDIDSSDMSSAEMGMPRHRDIDVIEDESTAEMMDNDSGKSPYESSLPSTSGGYEDETYDTSITGENEDVDIDVVKDNDNTDTNVDLDNMSEETTTGMDDKQKEAYWPKKGMEDQTERSISPINEETSAAIEVIDDEDSEGTTTTSMMDEEGKEGVTTEPVSARVEYISPLTKGEMFTAEDIQMAFYEGNEDPSWTVLIKGSPVATIKLSDQPRAEEIAEVFIKDEYAQNVAKALVECGPKEVLDQVKARYFANKIEQSELATRMYKKAKAQLEEAQRAALATMKEDFKACIATVLAGMNKNFWQDTENPLKGALFAKLHDELGISDPTSIIESAFEVSANSYFDIVLSKAIDFMSKSPETREEIAEAISGSNSVRASSVGTGYIPAAKKLAQRLEGNNVVAQVTGSGLSGKDKSNIKNIIRLGKSYN